MQAGTHVTFTQDTWEHIYKVKDSEYPDHRIVGWYHSHPGFGVFLSDHDTFIHQNFFSSPQQVAWVYDPHSEEEGCFAWADLVGSGKSLKRLSKISLLDEKGGEAAGETGKPEPQSGQVPEEKLAEKPASKTKPEDFAVAIKILSFICIFLLGALASWYLFPRPVYLLIDPRTGGVMVVTRQDVERLVGQNPAATAPQGKQ